MSSNIKQFKLKLSKELRSLFDDEGFFHYQDCGLDNIFIKGWVKFDDEGVSYSILDRKGLYAEIAKILVYSKNMLTPSEFKFLRKFLKLTQSKMGGLLGVDSQTIARWEKNEDPLALPKYADSKIRFQYMTAFEPLSTVTYFEKLIDIDIDGHSIDRKAQQAYRLEQKKVMNEVSANCS